MDDKDEDMEGVEVELKILTDTMMKVKKFLWNC